MANRYEIGNELGKGSFAKVFLCRKKNGSESARQYFAIKVINVTECKQQQQGASNIVGASNNNNRDNDGVYDQPQQQNVVPYTIESLLQREINVHLSVSSSKHPNIVQLYESFEYKNEVTGNDMSALVLEYCSFGDLQGYIKRIRHERKQQQQNDNSVGSRGILLPEGTFLSSNQIKHTLSQVLCGLSFLHSRGIVHRDIKPANIFLSPIQPMSDDDISSKKKGEENTQFTLLDCQIKLGDFGLANKMEDDEDWNEAQRTFCGTPSCIAPEVVLQADSTTAARIHTKSNDTNVEDNSILGIDASLFTQQTEGNHPRGYGQPADIWSTGCLLYTLIVGRNPFALPASQPTPNQDHSIEKTRRIQQIIERVKDNDWSVPANVRMNKSMEQLLYQLLEASPKKRGTARKILSMHPFFQLNSSMPDLSPNKKIEGANDTLEKQNVADQQEENMSINSSDHSYLFRSDSDSEEIEDINPRATGQSGSISAALSAVVKADSATLDLSLEVIEDLTKFQQLAAKSRPQTEQLHTRWSEEDKALDDVAEVSLTSTCQGIADLKEYQQAAAGSSSTVSKWTVSSSTAMAGQKIDETDEILSTIQIIKSTIGANDVMGQQSDAVKAKEQLPYIEETPDSHGALDRLPIKKYMWVESLSDTTTVRLTLFCLGTEGLVIQRETGSANDLWLHVSNDGEGILWGELKPKSTSLSSKASTKSQTDEQLLMEAYSRAPTEFSKQTLSSLLSLKCNDIISLYESLEDKINKIKATTSKLTLHLYTAGTADDTPQLVANTLLMENDDIETKFVKDGTIIRLSSSDESITVRGETGTVTKLDVDLIKLKNDDSPVPPSSKRMLNELEPLPQFVNNLCVFIESVRECLMIEAKEASSHIQTDHRYPLPLERKIVMAGWHRSDWISV